MRRRDVHHLPFPRHGDRQIADGNVFDEHPEQALAQVAGQSKFVAAPFRCKPRARDQEKHRLAAESRIAKRFLPAFAGLDPALGIKVQKNIVPTLLLEPTSECNSLCVVLTGVADKDARHARNLTTCACCARGGLRGAQKTRPRFLGPRSRLYMSLISN
jgi:hypothetical protein